jgi:ABC-type hemin transport system substrate-binding protein
VKHAFARRHAFHFNLQVVHAASVQKRGLFGDIINGTIAVLNQLQQQIQVAIIQAQSTIQGVGSRISNVTANVTASLQATATTILTQVSRFPACATAQTANVPNIVNQTGMLLYQLY